MTDICLAPDKLEALLTEINRHRALTDEETDLLEAIITRGHKAAGVRFAWTPRVERELKRAYSRPSGIKQFAEKYGISRNAAYMHLSRLRNVKRNDGPKQVRREG